MDTYRINEFLLELMQETSKELLRIYYEKPNRKTLLKFPNYRNKGRRISEQELRFTLINLFEKLPYPKLYYSIETPTSEGYCFEGAGNRSAISDLSFYYNDEKVLNIEFKANNPTQPSIDKDIKKLVSESCNGAWIHIFKNEDSGTVKSLFKKFNKAFEKYNQSKKPISFHILVLETQTLLSRKGKDMEYNYSNVFNIDYTLWKSLKKGKHLFLNGEPPNVEKIDEDWEGDWQIDVFNIKNEIENS